MSPKICCLCLSEIIWKLNIFNNFKYYCWPLFTLCGFGSKAVGPSSCQSFQKVRHEFSALCFVQRTQLLAIVFLFYISHSSLAFSS